MENKIWSINTIDFMHEFHSITIEYKIQYSPKTIGKLNPMGWIAPYKTLQFEGPQIKIFDLNRRPLLTEWRTYSLFLDIRLHPKLSLYLGHTYELTGMIKFYPEKFNGINNENMKIASAMFRPYNSNLMFDFINYPMGKPFRY